MTQRFAAWNFGGKTCPACGFEGGMLYTEVCKVCWGSLIYCPKCKKVECYGGSPSGIRTREAMAKALASNLSPT